MATDELILARTLGVGLARDGYGHLEQPETLYRPYVVRVGGAEIACLFRDHVLSDLIGFTYASWGAAEAAQDFVGRLVEAGRRYAARTGGGEAVIPVILDGENAWEHFEGQGRPFLRALYRTLATHPEIQDRDDERGRGCAGDTAERHLPGVVDQRRLLHLDRPSRRSPGLGPTGGRPPGHGRSRSGGHDRKASPAPARSCSSPRARTGSGGTATTTPRTTIWSSTTCSAGTSATSTAASTSRCPRSCTSPTSPPSRRAPSRTRRWACCTPTLDGEVTSYFEWVGAGELELSASAGSMHQVAPARRPLVTGIRFGFDAERLFVRVDLARRAQDVLVDKGEIRVSFFKPANHRLSVSGDGLRACRAELFERRGPEDWHPKPSARPSAAAAQILEMGVRLADLGVQPGDTVSFFVTLLQDGHALEQYPAHHPLDVQVPGADFAARLWSV